MAPCQECARPATYTQKNSKKYRGAGNLRRTTARADHDLCRRCWDKLMTSVRAAEQKNSVDH